MSATWIVRFKAPTPEQLVAFERRVGDGPGMEGSSNLRPRYSERELMTARKLVCGLESTSEGPADRMARTFAIRVADDLDIHQIADELGDTIDFLTPEPKYTPAGAGGFRLEGTLAAPGIDSTLLIPATVRTPDGDALSTPAQVDPDFAHHGARTPVGTSVWSAHARWGDLAKGEGVPIIVIDAGWPTMQAETIAGRTVARPLTSGPRVAWARGLAEPIPIHDHTGAPASANGEPDPKLSGHGVAVVGLLTGNLTTLHRALRTDAKAIAEGSNPITNLTPANTAIALAELASRHHTRWPPPGLCPKAQVHAIEVRQSDNLDSALHTAATMSPNGGIILLEVQLSEGVPVECVQSVYEAIRELSATHLILEPMGNPIDANGQVLHEPMGSPEWDKRTAAWRIQETSLLNSPPAGGILVGMASPGVTLFAGTKASGISLGSVGWYGPSVGCFAAGEAVVSYATPPIEPGAAATATLEADVSAGFGGTSSATAIVAGTAACVMSLARKVDSSLRINKLIHVLTTQGHPSRRGRGADWVTNEVGIMPDAEACARALGVPEPKPMWIAGPEGIVLDASRESPVGWSLPAPNTLPVITSTKIYKQARIYLSFVESTGVGSGLMRLRAWVTQDGATWTRVGSELLIPSLPAHQAVVVICLDELIEYPTAASKLRLGWCPIVDDPSGMPPAWVFEERPLLTPPNA